MGYTAEALALLLFRLWYPTNSATVTLSRPCSNLLARFYIDRSFNGNDWSAVHDKYGSLVASGKLSDSAAASQVS